MPATFTEVHGILFFIHKEIFFNEVINNYTFRGLH